MVIVIDEWPRIRCRVRISPPPHHVVAGEGMAEDVGHLAWRLEPATLIGAAERGAARHEQAARSRHAHLEYQPLQLIRDRH